MKALKMKQMSVPGKAWEGIKKKRQLGGGMGLDQ